ncbi:MULTISPECIES: phage tail tape measure protein [unclassified Cryobacterium]|uniref:phage tail tape measure protein n=1 Tax=unclassified Cryobacterium TaxID=2649013 RepID=UPI002AB3A1F0|nr:MULTISPECIES: phage tail tape measure protein [unclassified Cryobacterium]MDY7542598.1 phage tail tape measure protein [Cryobacterium sp. 5B3]MEB0264718.1 phage tail tape measure protein [Cryobacterium sp. 10I5]MEB0273690.1 phage tail tape measure protein [Cryobacterium sp. 5B3]
MFEAGAIAFRLTMVGADVFKRDAKAADQAVKELGTAAQAAATKVEPTSKALDKTSKSAKDAKAPLDGAAKSTKDVGTESETAAKKVTPLGTEIDKTGKASTAAKAPLDDTGKATKQLGDENTAAAPKVKQTAAELEALKVKSEQARDKVATAAVGIGAAVAAMSILAVSKYAEFDRAMSEVGAASMASAEDQKKLSAAALEAGAASIYSATESANAETELSKAGLSTADILGGALTGSLALAAAGQLGVARAAEIAATTLTVFKLSGDKAGHVADLLAAGAGKAQGSVEDLALGLDYVGVTFARLNIPLEDTVGTLALLASNGLLGEKAGTGLRSVISSLTAPVAKGAEAMAQYGINVWDAQGKFIGMAGVAEQLKKGLGGLDESTRSAALGAIFGAEAASAAGILYDAGADGVKKWTNEVNDQGYAAEQAWKATDNLSGDIERLGGSMDTALIKTGGAANGSLRDMVQILSNLIDWYSGLDGGMQSTVLWLGVGTAAVLLLGGTFMGAVPKIAEFKTAVGLLNSTMTKTAVVGGTIGLAITAAAIVLGAYAKINLDAKNRVDGYTRSLDESTGALTKNTREMVVNNLEQSGSAVASAQKLGISLADVTNAVLGEADAVAHVNKVISEHKGKSDEAGVAADVLGKVVASTKGEVADSETAWAAHKAALEGDTGATTVATAATEAAKVATEAATKASEDWIKAVSDQDAAFIDIGGAYQNVIDQNKAVAQATADGTKSSTDSWTDYYDGFTVNLDDYLAQLQTMVDSQNNWESNMILLAGKVSQGTLDELAKMGPEGAPLVAQLVSASGDELAKADSLFSEKAALATGAYALTLQQAETVVAAAAGQLGAGAAAEIAGKLAAGTSTVEQILADYGLKIDGFAPSVNVETDKAAAKVRALYALITSPGKSVSGSLLYVTGQANGSVLSAQANGSVRYFANGSGSEHHVAQIARAGEYRVWAEQETGGEAYIPMAESKRSRSTAILEDVAGQFGYQLVPVGAQQFAGGSSPSKTSAGRGGDRIFNIYETYDAQATALSIARIENNWGAV